MPASRWLLVMLVWLGSMLVACQPPVYTATLNVGDLNPTAGEIQGYSFQVLDDDGEDHTGDAQLTVLEVVPSEGVEQTNGKLLFTVATTYQLRATIQVDGQQLEARTSITISPAEAARVIVLADPPEPVAGEVVSLQGKLVDPYGNAAIPPGSFKISISPVAGVSQTSAQAVFTIADTYTITATELNRQWTGELKLKIGLAELIKLQLELSSNRIGPGQTISANVYGIDGYGNRGPTTAELRVLPNEGVSIKDEDIRFSEEGNYVVKAELPGLTPDEADVVVDGTAPILTLSSPERASFQTDADVRFVGTVSDALAGLKKLSINGADVRVLNGQFDQIFPAAPGTNIIELVAEDLNGNTSTLTQSFIYGPRWSPVGTPTPGGLYGRLNMPTINLITELLEDELDADALEADLLAENPIATYDDSGITATVLIEAFDYSLVEVILQPRRNSSNGDLYIQATFYNLYARLRAYGDAFFSDYNVTGELSASTGVAKGVARATVSNGVADVSIDPASLDVIFNDFDVSFSGTVLNSIGEILEGQIQDELETALEDYVLEEVPPFLEDYLTYLNYTYTTPLAIGELSTELTLSTQLEGLYFDDTGLSLAETTTLSAPASPEVPANPGAPQVGATGLVYPSAPGYLVSASYDALNTLLHTVWSTGILRYDYTVVADTGQSFMAAISLPLPPLVQPSLDPAYVIDATAGDIYLDLYLDPNGAATYRLAVSLVVPATVQTSPDGITISVLFGDPLVRFQVLEAPARGLDAAALGALVNELVVQLLAEAEGSLQNILLPEFEGYQLSVTQATTLGNGWGWLSIGGYLE